MRPVILLFLILAAIKSQAQAGYDTSSIALIPLDTSQSWSGHLQDNNPATASTAQVNLADSILRVCIAEHNNNGVQTKTAGMYIGIHEFKKQMVASVNSKGETVIWVNCFCEGFLEPYTVGKGRKKRTVTRADSIGEWDWKKEVLEIHDGGFGGCFFNVKINLQEKKYFDLMINGV